MKVVVVTGSTRGIGFCLAGALLARGCQVVVSGRTQEAVEVAVTALRDNFPENHILGVACDVSQYTQIEALWHAAVARFGRVDIWINNAGIANTLLPYWEIDPHEITKVISTNMIGTLYGTRVALERMRAQGGGAIYNMEGFGSNRGRMVNGLAIYGASKAGLSFFNRALADEVKGGPVIVGSFSPGMVATDMIFTQYQDKPEQWKKVRPVLNIIAERAETVAPWLAECALSNTQNGRQFKFSSPWKLMLRFITAPLQKRDVFAGMKEPV